MSVRTVLTWVGTAVGAYFGNPQLGYAIGSALGNAIDPEIIKGPSIGDIAQQTSQEGIPRPIVFGLSQPMAGNIIASGEPNVVRKRQRQGKGGPKVETEYVYRTYAIGICEGPINRVVRVWRNGELVYDRLVFDPEFAAEQVLEIFRERFTGNNQHFSQRARFYLGTWDQLPSPDLEAEFGVDVTPAHRGTAYMVMHQEDLTDLRGAIPQWVFQVERCEGTFVTSRPYSIYALDAVNSRGTVERALPFYSVPAEAVDSSGSITAGELDTALVTYNDGEPEAVNSSGSIESGNLVTALVTYNDGEPEAVNSSGSVEGGTLDPALIVYDEYPPEAVNSSGTIESGNLS